MKSNWILLEFFFKQENVLSYTSVLYFDLLNEINKMDKKGNIKDPEKDRYYW